MTSRKSNLRVYRNVLRSTLADAMRINRIIAILGLPDGKESDSPTEFAASWLNELLPRDLTTGCSISSFSWKPDRENAGFKGAAKCLQNEIRQKIKEPQYIFLAHSLGGIVAKEVVQS